MLSDPVNLSAFDRACRGVDAFQNKREVYDQLGEEGLKGGGGPGGAGGFSGFPGGGGGPGFQFHAQDPNDIFK